LLNYDISKFNNESKLYNIIFNKYNNILYDKILFLSNIFISLNNKEDMIHIYFNALSKITQNLKIEKQRNIEENSDFEDIELEAKRNSNYFETFSFIKNNRYFIWVLY